MQLARRRGARLALTLATIASAASASRTDVDGEPLRSTCVERAQLDVPLLAQALERNVSIDPEPSRRQPLPSQIFGFTYDALDRETSATYPIAVPAAGDDLASISTSYDGNGNVLSVLESYRGNGPPRTTTQTFDPFDRLFNRTDPQGKLLAYAYDANGNRTLLTDPDDRASHYTYDDLNRVDSVTTAAGAATYEYFKNGLLKKTTYPNGATATQAYDLANRTQSIVHRQNSALISSFAYTYDPNGNRSSQVETNGGAPESTTYTYDLGDRLTGVAYPGEEVTYTLDGVGNRATETTVDANDVPLSIKTYGYDARDRLQSISDSLVPANDAQFSYDANGNRIGRDRGEVETGFLYDSLDQLVEVTADGSLVERSGYDYRGLRTRRAGSGSIFRYVYDDQSVLVVTDDSGFTLSKYEWGPDRLLSLNHVTEGRTFHLFDGLGSVVGLSRPDGGIQVRYRWDAWGNLRSQTGDSENLFGFTGYERDEATGLYYAKARFYDPEIGRFLNEDPFGGIADTPPSLHRFLYAHGNPTVFIDPDGRIAVLKEAQAWLERAKEDVIAQAGDKNAGSSGALAGAIQIAADAVGAMNVAANTVAAVLPGTGAAKREAEQEITQAAEAARAVVERGIKAVASDPGGTVQRTSEAVVGGTVGGAAEWGSDAFSNDPTRRANAAAGFVAVAGEIALLEAGAAARAERTVASAIDELPAQSVPTKRQSVTVGESATTGGATVAESPITRSAPATESAAGRTLVIPREKAANFAAYEKAAAEGTLVRTDAKTVRGSGFRKQTEAVHGPPPTATSQADHVVELCVGGSPCATSNAQWLAAHPNQVAGGKLGAQIKNDPVGTKYTKVRLEEEK